MTLPRNFLLDIDEDWQKNKPKHPAGFNTDFKSLSKTLRGLGLMRLEDTPDVGLSNLKLKRPDELLAGLRKLGRNPDTEAFLKSLKPDITDDDLDAILPKTVPLKVPQRKESPFAIDLNKQAIRADLMSEQGVLAEDPRLEEGLKNIRQEMKLPLESHFEYFKTPEGETRLRLTNVPTTTREPMPMVEETLIGPLKTWIQNVTKGGMEPARADLYAKGFIEQLYAAQPSWGAKSPEEMSTLEKNLRFASVILPLIPGIGFAAKPEALAAGRAIREVAPAIKQTARELALSEAGAIGKQAGKEPIDEFAAKMRASLSKEAGFEPAKPVTQPLPEKAPFEAPKAEAPPKLSIEDEIEQKVAALRATGGAPPKQPPTAVAATPPPPKSPLGIVEDMWAKGRKPPKEASEAYLKWQEQLNDAYFGIRRMQGQVGKGVTSGGPEDVITLLTRAPGAANAGATRYILTVSELKKIAPNTMADDINTILFANHAKEVLASKGPERVMAGGFKDATELDAVLTQLQKKLGKQGYDDALQAAEYVKAVYVEELSGLVNEGLVSKELAEELSTKYPWYNPLRYVDDAAEMEARGKSTKPFSVISSGLSRLSEKGTAKESIAPLNVMADQLIRNEVRIVKNQTARAIVNLAKKEPSLGVKKITGIRPVATVEGKEIFRPTGEDLPGTLSFFENGTRQIYEVPDFIYREANVLNKTISNPVSSLIGSLNGISRAAFTTVSPPFVVSNMLNDMLTAFVNRGIMPQQTITRLVQSLRGLEKDKIMQAFRLGGGYQQRFYGKSSQELAKRVGVSGGKIITDSQSFMKKIADIIPTAGETGEQAPRMALFKRQLDKTLPDWKKMSAEEIAATPQGRKAAADAVELTINFGRGGYLVKAANPFVIFLNANMEGTKLPFRVLRDNPAARWRLATVGAGATGITAYNLSYPEYMDIPNNIRWGSFVIMLPSKEKNLDGTNKPNYVTIVPRTREWGAFLGSLTYGMERMFANSPDEFGTFTGGMAPMLVPLAEVPGPALIQELTGQLANWDFYYSEPIVSQSLQNLPAEEQVYPSTSRTIQLAANVAGVSPVRAQHFANGIFGGAGRAVTSVTDLVANWLAPQEVSDRIKGLVEQYQELPEDQQKGFLDRMAASDKRAMLNYLNKSGFRIPILSDIGKRIMPGRGGRLEEQQYQLEQSVDFLPSYWTDVMTPEEMKAVDIPFWEKKKKEDAIVVQDYDLNMMGKSDYDRDQYRKTNPDTDVILNLWSHVKTISTLQGARQLKQVAEELGIPMSAIPAFGKTDSGKEKLPREGLWPDFFDYYKINKLDKETGKMVADTAKREAFRKVHPEFEKWGEANLGWKPLSSSSGGIPNTGAR